MGENCRYYEAKFPEVDDMVVVRVKSIADMGAYVTLLEYNNIEGMILFSELSRRRIRSISKLIRVGRQEVCVVLRVDKEKGYIDLSKRRVSPEDVIKVEDKFNKSKTVYGIMRHCAEVVNEKLETLMEKIAWPLYKKYGHAFDAFKAALSEPDKMFEGLDMTPSVRAALLEIIERRLRPQAVKLRVDMEVTCFDYDGIDAIKLALHAGETCGTAENPIKVHLVAPPLYVMDTTSLDKAEGLKSLNHALDVISEELKKRNGNLKIKIAPRAVSESDEHDLTTLMNELQKQNTEVSGDDDADEDGDAEEEM